MPNLRQILTIIAITLAVFIFTKNPVTKPFSLQITLVVGLALFVFYLRLRNSKKKLSQNKTFLNSATLFILLLVAITGWFLSPFFYLLYLLAIILGVTNSVSVALAFIATLVGLFSVSVGEVDIVYDVLVILSYLTVIPFIYYFRRISRPS